MQLTRVMCLNKLNSPSANYITLRVQRSTKPLAPLLLFGFHFPASSATLQTWWSCSLLAQTEERRRLCDKEAQKRSRELLLVCIYIYLYWQRRARMLMKTTIALSLCCVYIHMWVRKRVWNSAGALTLQRWRHSTLSGKCKFRQARHPAGARRWRMRRSFLMVLRGIHQTHKLRHSSAQISKRPHDSVNSRPI